MIDSSCKLRIGLVGAGMISARHLTAWSRAPDAGVIAVADCIIERAYHRASEFRIPRYYSSLEEMLNHEAVDALDITASRESHSALVRQAAARALPILCQKPLAPTYQEAKALVDETRGRTTIMINENWRFQPTFRQIAEWIDHDQFGTLTAGFFSIRSSGLLQDESGCYPSLERQPSIKDEKRLLVAEVLIHHIDVARWLFGPLRLVGARLRRDLAIVDGETSATLMLETELGSPIVIDGSFNCPGYPATGEERVELIGSRATVQLNSKQLKFTGLNGDLMAYNYRTPYQDGFDAAISHFAQALRAGHPFETDATDNLLTLQLVEAAYAFAGSR